MFHNSTLKILYTWLFTVITIEFYLADFFASLEVLFEWQDGAMMRIAHLCGIMTLPLAVVLLYVFFKKRKKFRLEAKVEETKKNYMDYHYNCVKPEEINERNKYISDRWSELHGFYTRCADEIKKYLFYVNAGGAVAVLGFMGTSEAVRKLPFVIISLCCFALGLLLIGVLHTIATHMAK